MKSRTIFSYFVSLPLFLFFVGCTHTLDVTNLSSYRATQVTSLKAHKTIGIICNSSEIADKRLVKGIATSLNSQCDVVMPYSQGSSRQVDYVVKLDIGSEYKGSGYNFLINWPGFLIFAPAWNGYIYNINYNLDVALTKNSDKTTIDSFKVPINLDVRHANYNRTWTELSWLEVSAIAFVGGILFTQYDDNVTPLVIDKVETPIGDYVAQEILSRISAQEI